MKWSFPHKFFSACLLLSAAFSCACTSAPADDGSASGATTTHLAALSVEPVLPPAVSRIFDRSCKSCHGPDGRGLTAIAPDLRHAAPREAAAWEQYLSGSHPGSQMPPPTWLDADEAKLIAAYLADLQGAAQSDAPPIAEPLR
jgi:mono/diheme cytochrome c family protein